MRKPGGTLICTDSDGRETCQDTVTCGHCNGIVIVGPKQRPEDIGGMCKLCMTFTCPRCTNRGECTPFERRLEQHEARYHALRSYGMT